MVFSDTSTKLGLIQRCEDWCNLGDGQISGDTTLLKQFTAKINDAFDELMPLLLSYTDKGKWDDNNNVDFPIATFNLVSGQNDYSAKVDGSSLDILRVFDVQILTSATATDYVTLTKINLEDPRAVNAMAPNSTDTGTPTWWLERDNVVFLNPKPNFNATSGVKIFYEREQSRFAYTDTTKEPGIPVPFHPLLAMIASHQWTILNKSGNTPAITRLEAKIAEAKQRLSDLADARNPSKGRFSTAYEPTSGRIRYPDSNK